MSSDGSDIHFFKRIEEDTLRNGELRIPRSFVTKYWEGISNPILLLLPNDAKWEVFWEKIGADVWLINKWKKFAEFYSLDQDHLLVFNYVEKSRFQVLIFHQNGLEMVYPLTEGTLNGEENGNSLRQRKRAKSPLSFSRFTKKVKTNPRMEPKSYPSQVVETKSAQSPCNKVELLQKPKKRGGRPKSANKGCSKSKAVSVTQSEELLEDSESGTALERAKAFRSPNPFFIREMHPSYIQTCLLAMPGNFITEDQRKEGNHVTLWMTEERTWNVKFCPNRCTGQITLSAGWKNFVMENDLKIGNVCVFEQIKKPGISFRVIIYRDREKSHPAAMLSDSEIRRLNNGKSDNNFTLSITPKQCYHKYIPRKFIRNHDFYNMNEVTLRFGKRSWHVKVDDYGRLTSGWSEFMSQCNLKAGDDCHFELIDKKKFVFRVSFTTRID